MKTSGIALILLAAFGIAMSQAADQPISTIKKQAEDAVAQDQIDEYLAEAWDSGSAEQIKAILSVPKACSLSIQRYQHKPPSVARPFLKSSFAKA